MKTRTWADVTAVFLVALATMFIIQWCGCGIARAEPDYNALADSIRVAEGNPNYGILTHYKHTSYRQACINTCKHAFKDYSLGMATPPRIEGKGHRNVSLGGYLQFLANRYAPIGVKNDPKGLNNNWLANVSKLYKGDI